MINLFKIITICSLILSFPACTNQEESKKPIDIQHEVSGDTIVENKKEVSMDEFKKLLTYVPIQSGNIDTISKKNLIIHSFEVMDSKNINFENHTLYTYVNSNNELINSYTPLSGDYIMQFDSGNLIASKEDVYDLVKEMYNIEIVDELQDSKHLDDVYSRFGTIIVCYNDYLYEIETGGGYGDEDYSYSIDNYEIIADNTLTIYTTTTVSTDEAFDITTSTHKNKFIFKYENNRYYWYSSEII